MNGMTENSLLAMTDPVLLVISAAAICFLGYFCARRFKNTNDFAKSVRLYLPLMAVADCIIVWGWNLYILLLAGIDICGFIVMALASNYYFYHGS